MRKGTKAMQNSDEERAAEDVLGRWATFGLALSDKRKYPVQGFYVALPSGGRAVYLLSSHRSCWERYRGFHQVRRTEPFGQVNLLKSLLPAVGGSIVPETCAVPEGRCRLKKAGSTAMIAVCLVPLCPFKSLISVAAVHCLVARLRSEKRPISTPLESLCHDRQPSRA